MPVEQSVSQSSNSATVTCPVCQLHLNRTVVHFTAVHLATFARSAHPAVCTAAAQTQQCVQCVFAVSPLCWARLARAFKHALSTCPACDTISTACLRAADVPAVLPTGAHNVNLRHAAHTSCSRGSLPYDLTHPCHAAATSSQVHLPPPSSSWAVQASGSEACM